jgi:hypothetical protein
MENLNDLANRFKSDKGDYSHAHKYTQLYELLFYGYRDLDLHFLEMGLQIGGPELGQDADRKTDDLPSIRMWLEYFPFAKITGLDVSDFSWFSHPRFEFVRCDMNERAQIKKAAEKISRPLDIIIDDASHASLHQQFGFLELFPKLNPGGLYIIEDLHWQPRRFERAAGNPTKTGALFHSYRNASVFEHSDPEIAKEFNDLRDEISFHYVFPHQYIPNSPDKVLVVQKKVR